MTLGRTFVMIKPDGLEKKCMGSTINLIEQEDLRITRMELKTLATSEAELLYYEHKNEWYFDRNILHVTSGPVVIMQVEGMDVINKTRKIVEQIRKEFDADLPRNSIHASTEENKAIKELISVGF